jgi:adenine-specific DNA methylase
MFDKLIKQTKEKTKFLLLSYNNGGIIPIKEIDSLLNKYGSVYKIPVEHKTYNKLKGIAAYKRKKKVSEVKEFLWLVDFR